MPDVPAVTDSELSSFDLARLAREMVMRIRDPDQILLSFGLNKGKYKDLCNSKTYKQIHDAIEQDWESATNTETRIKIQAAAFLEQAIPTMSGRIMNEKEPLREVVEGGKLFAKLAGLTEPHEKSGGGSEKFVINIDLGADKKLHFEKEVNGVTIDVKPDGT